MKFQGTYEYMGFFITNNEDSHIWDLEPLGWEIAAIERFKHEAPGFKTLAAARKWIREDGQKLLKEHDLSQAIYVPTEEEEKTIDWDAFERGAE